MQGFFLELLLTAMLAFSVLMLPTLNVVVTVVGPVIAPLFSADLEDHRGIDAHRNQTSRYWPLRSRGQSRRITRCRNRKQQMEII